MEWRGVTERPGFHEYLTWLNLIMDKVFFHGSESVYVCLCGADYRGGPCYLHRPDACCGTPLTWRLGEGRVLSLCFQIPPPLSSRPAAPLSSTTLLTFHPSLHLFFFFGSHSHKCVIVHSAVLQWRRRCHAGRKSIRKRAAGRPHQLCVWDTRQHPNCLFFKSLRDIWENNQETKSCLAASS